MNYTMGKWTVRSGFKVTCGEEQVWIADCYPFHEKHPRPRIVEAEANARLIAAAPDMYEALKAALEYASLLGDARIIIEKALAKAAGE